MHDSPTQEAGIGSSVETFSMRFWGEGHAVDRGGISAEIPPRKNEGRRAAPLMLLETLPKLGRIDLKRATPVENPGFTCHFNKNSRGGWDNS